MTISVKTNKLWRTGKIIFGLGILTFLLLIIAFSAYYLFSSHAHLVSRYYQLNSCFYRATSWDTKVFTQGIKSDGNTYSILSLVIASSCIMYLFYKRKHFIQISLKPDIYLQVYDAILVVAGIVVAVLLWIWGNRLASPAYDEVFSAQNAAGIHPFQCVSYYMLPNNHLCFNLLNSLLFHSFSNKVLTGRIISLLTYCSFIIVIFFWFKGLIQNRLLAFIMSIVIAMQFQVWGFSFQARGYELYLLCEWGSLISLFAFIHSDNKKWLRLNLLCVAIGYFSIPSFLYFHVAELLFMLLYQILYKKRALTFWKYQLLAFLLTFFCYLPGLCFSGLQMIANNNYVAPMDHYKTTSDFCQWMFPATIPYIKNIFSDIHSQGHTIALILFLLPIALLLNRKNKMNVLFGLFYLITWIIYFIVVIAMKRMPFERNLIGHYSITLAGVLLVAHWISGIRIAGTTFLSRTLLLPSVIILLAIHFLRTDEYLLKSTLYEYDVNANFHRVSDALDFIPAGSTVAFSDEAFYCYYICKTKGCKTDKCGTGNEEYFIDQACENLTLPSGRYALVKTINDYNVYKKK